MTDIPPCPPTLKAIQHYLKIAQEHSTRDPVVTYWGQLYALQTALTIDRKSDESKVFLMDIMGRLEVMKKNMKENEAITNEVVAQAHIENYALKLFVWADTQDRSSNFGKNVVKAFYTSGMLYDMLTTFGELSEEVQQNRKYAKWKAAYIHNCLKNGETPVPGPMQMDGEEGDSAGGNDTASGSGPSGSENNDQQPSDSFPSVPKPASSGSGNLIDDFGLPQVPPSLPNEGPTGYNPNIPMQPNLPSPGFGFNTIQQPSPPAQPFNPSPSPSSAPSDSSWKSNVSGAVHLTPDQMTKAQKYCKFAGSALAYDDVPTAIQNLEKALHLLKTGADSS